MSRQLILLRHGQTAWNALGRIQGHADVELNELGHDQAAAAAPHVAAYQPSRLWTSDLARASQTAAYVAKEGGLEARPDPRFRELDLGERSGMTLVDYERRFPEEYAAFLAGDFRQLRGAETLTEVATRFEAGLLDVLIDLPDGETGVIVSHGTAIKVAITRAVGWGDADAAGLRGLDNCTWAVLREVERTGRFRLADYNRSVRPPLVDPDFTYGRGVG